MIHIQEATGKNTGRPNMKTSEPHPWIEAKTPPKEDGRYMACSFETIGRVTFLGELRFEKGYKNQYRWFQQTISLIGKSIIEIDVTERVSCWSKMEWLMPEDERV